MSVYQKMLACYQTDDFPWNDTLPPPEVMDFVPTLPVGRALDLGCGPGRASIYMAGLGWDVDGVDFVPKAIEMAKARAKAAGVAPRFHQGSVTALDFLTGPYDFALDVGCCHALRGADLRAYHGQLRRLLRAGGHYLLFARVADNESAAAEGPPWTDEAVLKRLFEDGFSLEQVIYGTTKIGDAQPWRSAWFWYVRNAA